MPQFRYRALQRDGQVVQGEISADSRDLALAEIRAAGQIPVEAEEHSGTQSVLIRRLRSWRSTRTLGNDQIAHLVRELATVLQAGLPLDGAVGIVGRTTEDRVMRTLTEDVRKALQAGRSLSDALAEHPQYFHPYSISMIRAGEASGTLPVVLAELADYLDRMLALRQSVVTALIYPAILLVTAIVALVGLMTLVVPRFMPFFEDAGKSLPWITELIFGLSMFLTRYWWLLLALVAFIVVIARQMLVRPEFRRRFDAWSLKLPLIGRLLAASDTARLSRTLATLLENGVPLLESIRHARGVVGNRIIADELESVEVGLRHGKRMSATLSQSRVLPSIAIELIGVGEESSQLPALLNKVADIHDQQVQIAIRRLLAVLEPVLILGLGALIAVIIVSILLSILGLNELIV